MSLECIVCLEKKSHKRTSDKDDFYTARVSSKQKNDCQMVLYEFVSGHAGEV